MKKWIAYLVAAFIVAGALVAIAFWLFQLSLGLSVIIAISGVSGGIFAEWLAKKRNRNTVSI